MNTTIMPLARSSRSPRGERGLKFGLLVYHSQEARRSPRGERGLKSAPPDSRPPEEGRSPRGERGLKFLIPALISSAIMASLPSRGAWIEMVEQVRPLTLSDCRSPRGERGLKFRGFHPCEGPDTSLPSRGAWIEIVTPSC